MQNVKSFLPILHKAFFTGPQCPVNTTHARKVAISLQRVQFCRSAMIDNRHLLRSNFATELRQFRCSRLRIASSANRIATRLSRMSEQLLHVPSRYFAACDGRVPEEMQLCDVDLSRIAMRVWMAFLESLLQCKQPIRYFEVIKNNSLNA
jgi:hypothetical protein